MFLYDTKSLNTHHSTGIAIINRYHCVGEEKEEWKDEENCPVLQSLDVAEPAIEPHFVWLSDALHWDPFSQDFRSTFSVAETQEFPAPKAQSLWIFSKVLSPDNWPHHSKCGRLGCGMNRALT